MYEVSSCNDQDSESRIRFHHSAAMLIARAHKETMHELLGAQCASDPLVPASQ
jgi:hypothetical protein